ncbi:D-altritol 5-dehydrogenase [subsurface metagenome]
MKSLIYQGPRKLAVKENPFPDQPVVVEMLASGVCGTDLKTFLHGHPMFTPPTILGHEGYGKVVKTTAKIPGIEIGSTVVIAPYMECGKCSRCVSGIPELCTEKTHAQSGYFTEYISMSEKHAGMALFNIDNDNNVYTLVEPLACVFNGIEKLGKIENTLIVGGGIMGALFAGAFKKNGTKTKIIEVSEWKTTYLKRMGYEVLTPDELGSEERFSAVILATNILDLADIYFNRIIDGGRLLLFAGYGRGTKLEIDPFHIHYREVSVVGSFGYASNHFRDALYIISKSPESYSNLISHEFALEDAGRAFSIMEEGKVMKVVLRIKK